ncbi:MAG: cytochrome c maturation protein CcmE [Bdellovibrionales bacterium]
MTPAARKKLKSRLLVVVLFLLGIGTATALTLTALQENLSYFRTTSDIASGQYPEREKNRAFRLGGMVEQGSVKREGATLVFKVTDFHNSLEIRFNGIPPDLFREGQGIVAEGKMSRDGQSFLATRLLAKHDENYMPPELAKTLPPQNKH